MKTIAMVCLSALALILGSAAAQDDKAAPKAAEPAPKAAEAPSELKDMKAKASYSIGLGMGKNMKAQSIDLDPQAIAKGIADGLAGSKPLLTEDEMEAVMESFQKEMTLKKAEMAKKVSEENKVQGEKNKKEGDAYLAKNKTKPGVKTTKSGLQYEVLREGTGPTPKPTDSVRAHYSGKLLDGTEFDSSYKRGAPSPFGVNEVIAGWTEGLQLMKVGSKYRLTIPSNLAYGERGRPSIPPNAVLVFELELIGID